MRTFVTGGTGFIGSYLVRSLRKRGHEVVALVRNQPKAKALGELGATLVQGDLTDRSVVRASMEGCDAVFHLAAYYQVGGDGSRAEEINVQGTRNVLETMRDLGIPRGVYTSTLAVNSDTGGRRVDESYRHVGPHLSAYDETKWRAHHEVALPLIEQGVPLVIVMPGVVYGPGDTSQVGGQLERATSGKLVLLPGEPTGACWAHVEDVAQAHLLALERGRTGESYIIAGPCHTFREAFETAARASGRRLRAVWLSPGMLGRLSRVVRVVEKVFPVPPTYASETMQVTAGTTYYGDNSKAARELGYAPRSLEQGMREAFG